jgi:hypothetical protein
MPRLKFQPTDEQRRRVKALAGYGVRHQQIAVLLGLASTTTLRRHFAEELRMGSTEAKAQMLRALFKLAVSGHHPAMTMFWLKTRAGWSEKGNPPEAVEPDGHARWVVRVYQPPRTPQRYKALESATDNAQDEW